MHADTRCTIPIHDADADRYPGPIGHLRKQGARARAKGEGRGARGEGADRKYRVLSTDTIGGINRLSVHLSLRYYGMVTDKFQVPRQVGQGCIVVVCNNEYYYIIHNTKHDV